MPTIPFYETLTIPAGTTVLAPVSQSLTTVPGRVILLRLFVPPGPRGEVALWFKHQNSQLAPAAPKTWDNLDDDIISWPLDYVVGQGETEFHLFGAAPDANFQHDIDFEVLVEAASEASQPTGGPGLTDRLMEFLGV